MATSMVDDLINVMNTHLSKEECLNFIDKFIKSKADSDDYEEILDMLNDKTNIFNYCERFGLVPDEITDVYSMDEIADSVRWMDSEDQNIICEALDIDVKYYNAGIKTLYDENVYEELMLIKKLCSLEELRKIRRLLETKKEKSK